VQDFELQSKAKDLMAFTDYKCHWIINWCKNEGYAFLEVGYELLGSNNEVVGMAELAWPSYNAAIFLPEQEDYMSVFNSSGWTCHTIQNVNSENLKDTINKLK